MGKIINIIKYKAKEIVIVKAGEKFTISSSYVVIDDSDQEYTEKRHLLREDELTPLQLQKIKDAITVVENKIKKQEEP